MLEPWVSGLASPSGLAISAAGDVYVTEEKTGRLLRISPERKALPVADGLGKAREAVFLDERTLLVTDRGAGAVFKVTLP